MPVDATSRTLVTGRTRHRDGHDSAGAGQETFLFGKWFGGGPPITAARLRPCPAPSTDVVLWGRRDNVLSGAAGPFSYKTQELPCADSHTLPAAVLIQAYEYPALLALSQDTLGHHEMD